MLWCQLCSRSQASPGLLPHRWACKPLLCSCPHGGAGAGADRDQKPHKPSRAEQTGFTEQPSSHSLHHVSGSLAFTGFVGWKIWVYVCTYNIWQQGGIQIQLWRMLFAQVTVLAGHLFQRLLSQELFMEK